MEIQQKKSTLLPLLFFFLTIIYVFYKNIIFCYINLWKKIKTYYFVLRANNFFEPIYWSWKSDMIMVALTIRTITKITSSLPPINSCIGYGLDPIFKRSGKTKYSPKNFLGSIPYELSCDPYTRYATNGPVTFIVGSLSYTGKHKRTDVFLFLK